LWDDFIQEETREEALCSRESKGEENEENVALVAAKKDKKSSHGEKDMSKVRCYACRELGHYVGQCLNKKRSKKDVKVSTSTEVVEFMKTFEKEFFLDGVSCRYWVPRVYRHPCRVLGQWGLSIHDEDEVCIPQFFRDRLK
jgi:hypothetical protein